MFVSMKNLTVLCTDYYLPLFGKYHYKNYIPYYDQEVCILLKLQLVINNLLSKLLSFTIYSTLITFNLV